MNKKNILFLCTGNSCRSQMAEAICNRYRGNEFDCYSAGVEKSERIDPRAVKVMAEIGLDISNKKPKSTNQLPVKEFDYVVTLCSHANETCPYFPAKTKVIHRGFDDPPVITKDIVDEEKILDQYRRVRDEIRAFIVSEFKL
jgi:arsenate reductase (thioredoxin)